MATVEERRSAPTVPYAMELPDRVRKERYFDPEFHAMENELLWPRVWQMACRLEEIPAPRDFVEYEFLDQSIIVVRTEDMGARAFQHACRLRGVKVVEGRQPQTFSEHNVDPEDINLAAVRCEMWGGCAWINLDDDAPPLRECLDPAATMLDAWRVEALRTEWWYAARLPVNWKLGIEAFVEMYHVVQTHPQLAVPTRFGPRQGAPFDPRAFTDANIRFLGLLSDGMGGMVHASDVSVAESLRDMDLPADPKQAMATWNRKLNDAVVRWHRDRGADIPDLNELDEQGVNLSFFHCFPHYFVLPMYSSASAYRFRPLGPEETLMEIWSLTRFPEGEEPEAPTPPELWEADDPRWPPIPTQDFSNLPRQQKGLHARSFEYMRLSSGLEGHISNFERTIDGFLVGLPHERLLPALAMVNVYPFEQPILDLGF